MHLTNRFFWLFGFVALFFSLAYPFPWLFPAALTAFSIALALVLTDFLLLYYQKPKLLVQREMNAVFSLSDANPVKIHLDNQSRLNLYLTVIDELPVQFQRRDFEMEHYLPSGGAHTMHYTLLPLSRGVYAFGDINVFARTRLSLVERNLKAHQQQEVSVYPSILQMKRYELRPIQQIAQESGVKKMRRIGHSYEFEQIKNYVPGDDYRSINWKASSRRGSLMVNQYEDERSQQVYCIVDKSRVMLMPFEGLSLMDYAINTTLAISNIIIKKMTRRGCLLFPM